MAKVVSLNKARKQRDRAERRRVADENAVRFGRSKAERTRDRAAREAEEKRLDDHRRD